MQTLSDTIYRCRKADYKSYFKLLLPALAEMTITALFAIVDTAMLGATDNPEVNISAVGFTNAPVCILFSTITCFCYGVSAVVAQCRGAGDGEGCRKAVRQTMLAISAVGLLLSVVGILFAEKIFTALGANEEIFDSTVTYFKIILVGLLFHSLTACVTAALRGVGETRIPMYYNLAAGVINVGLNYLLIFGNLGFPQLGIAGAAIATTVSRFAAAAAALIAILVKKTEVRVILREKLEYDAVIMARVLKIGLTAAAEQLILQGGAVLTTRIISVIPTHDYAASQIAASAESLLWSSGSAFNAAAMTLAGQATGEGNKPKCGAFTKLAWRSAMVFAVIVAAVFLFFGNAVTSIYTPDAELASSAASLLRITAVSLFGILTHLTISGALRGMGEAKGPLLASFISLWVFRVLLSYVLIRVMGMGIYAFCFCCMLDQLVRAALSTAIYLRIMRKEPAPRRVSAIRALHKA